jgi:hypothetical protein
MNSESVFRLRNFNIVGFSIFFICFFVEKPTNKKQINKCRKTYDIKVA